MKKSSTGIGRLLILIVILLGIFEGLKAIAGSNILIDRDSRTVTVSGISEAEDKLGYRAEIPEEIAENCGVEINKSTNLMHVYNEKGEVIIVDRQEGDFDYFSKTEIKVEDQIENTEKFEDIRIRRAESSGYDITMISYRDKEHEYSAILLGNRDREEIESVLNNIRE